jgi:hypothetical protein
MLRGFALSNPPGLINVQGIAGPGIGLSQAVSGQNLRACSKPKLDPYSSYRSN